ASSDRSFALLIAAVPCMASRVNVRAASWLHSEWRCHSRKPFHLLARLPAPPPRSRASIVVLTAARTANAPLAAHARTEWAGPGGGTLRRHRPRRAEVSKASQRSAEVRRGQCPAPVFLGTKSRTAQSRFTAGPTRGGAYSLLDVILTGAIQTSRDGSTAATPLT